MVEQAPPSETGEEAVARARELGTPTDAEAQSMEGGLQYIDVKTGSGDSPQPGQNVVVHYTGWLVDGTQFDSSRTRNEPFEFTLGQVIEGWDVGVATMKPGGAQTIIPTRWPTASRASPGDPAASHPHLRGRAAHGSENPPPGRGAPRVRRARPTR